MDNMPKTKSTQNKTFSVTRDSGANLKKLRRLEQEGYIKIHDVLGENETSKVPEKIQPVGVWGYFRWNDGSVYAGRGCAYSEIRKVIGAQNIQDARKLEAHIRKGNEYFVTEDRDFLDVKDELKEKFDVVVVRPEELRCICQK